MSAGVFNAAGVAFIHTRTAPLAVYSMEDAAKVIGEALEKRSLAVTEGNIVPKDPEQFGRHLAWLIGFDALLDDRKAIQAVTSLLVQP